MQKPKHAKKKFKKRGQLKSGLEIRINKELKKAKANYKYEDVALDYTLTKKYWPDFVVIVERKGMVPRRMFLEVKGYFDAQSRTKMRAVKETNPHLDIRMVFDKDNRISGSKMRYSDWCKKYGLPYCVGSIPKDWFE